MFNIKPIFLNELATLLGGKLYGKDCIIDSVYYNSKEKCNENACFIAINGKKHNGIDFINEVLQLGAKAIICEENVNTNVPYIKVLNSIESLGIIAKRSIENKKIIGITGSVGKSTTKNMIISVLGEKYVVCGTYKNENNEIGVAKTLLNAQNCDYCVVEMGMRGLGEIDYLANISKPETAVITNIGTSHIELLGSKEKIFKAKMEILNYNPKNFVSWYDARYENYDFKGINTYFVGEQSEYTAKVENIDKSGIEFRIIRSNKKSKIMRIYSLNLANLHNALIAYRVGKIYDLNDDEISNGLVKYKQEKMHGECEKIRGIFVINDAYNASLESFKASVDYLIRYAKIFGKRPNILIGDILEAGEKESAFYGEIISLCLKRKIEKIYLFGKRINHYAETLKGVEHLFDINESCKKIILDLNSQDVLLIKGSRGMRLERIIEEMRKYNE